MAKQSQALYLSNVMQLTDTLVIKFHEAALALNQYYLDFYGVDYSETPQSTWPYYRNLAGQYVTGYDTPMTVTSLDTTVDIDFTYENLQIHRATAKAYSIGSSYYRELLSRYPTQDLLIRGIINPTNIADAINSPNFTILNYDDTLVESNETNLIVELQRRINQFTLRWYYPRWSITQTLYNAGFFLQLINAIPLMIMNTRSLNCGTRFVHSYHLWGYLGSYARLDRWQDYLTQTQALWLYRNIAVLINNAGKTGTFDALLENLITARAIPLTKHELWHNVSEMPDALYATTEVAKLPLNTYAVNQDGIVKTTIEDVLTRELPLARDNDLYYRNQLYALPLASRSSYVNQIPTKVLESQMVDRTENVPVKLSATVFNQWVALAANGRYVAEVAITSPVTGEVLNLSQIDAVILWAYCCARGYGSTLVTIPPIMTHNVMRMMMPSYDELRASVPETYISRADILVSLDHYAAPGKIVSRDAFQQYCHSAYDASSFYRQQVAFCEDPKRRGYMEGMCMRFYQKSRVSLAPLDMTYDDWFASRNIDFSSLNAARIDEFGEDLYANATGSDLKDITSVKEIQAAMIGIMTQLSSYSIHYLKEINSGPFNTPNNVASRFGVRGETDFERYHIEIGTRFQDMGEREGERVYLPPAVVMGGNQIGIKEHDRVDFGRPVGFSQRGGSRERVRILIPRAVFSAKVGPSIAELTDRTVFNGTGLIEFTDPVITTGMVIVTGTDTTTF